MGSFFIAVDERTLHMTSKNRGPMLTTSFFGNFRQHRMICAGRWCDQRWAERCNAMSEKVLWYLLNALLDCSHIIGKIDTVTTCSLTRIIKPVMLYGYRTLSITKHKIKNIVFETWRRCCNIKFIFRFVTLLTIDLQINEARCNDGPVAIYLRVCLFLFIEEDLFRIYNLSCADPEIIHDQLMIT